MAWLRVRYLAMTSGLSSVKTTFLPNQNPHSVLFNILVSRGEKL